MKTRNTLFAKGCMVLASAALLTTGCTDDFLKQDPLSFYNPENTYNVSHVPVLQNPVYKPQ